MVAALMLPIVLFILSREPSGQLAETGLSEEGGEVKGAEISVNSEIFELVGNNLPPLNIPLRLYLTELREQAESGNPHAACRLAAEYDLCRSNEARIDSVEGTIRQRSLLYFNNQDNSLPENEPYELILFAGDLLNKANHCEGAKVPKPNEIARFWRIAAAGGHVPSMRNYAAGNAFKSRDTLDNIEELARYRGEAESMARTAARAGDGLTYFALASAYSPSGQDALRTLLAQATGPDAKEALIIYKQLRSHYSLASDSNRDVGIINYIEQRIEKLKSYVAESEVVEAEREAALRLNSWPRPHFPEEVPLPLIHLGALPPIERENCEYGFER